MHARALWSDASRQLARDPAAISTAEPVASPPLQAQRTIGWESARRMVERLEAEVLGRLEDIAAKTRA